MKRSYVDGAQAQWEAFDQSTRHSWLRIALGTEAQPLRFAGCFDLYGDMPQSVSDALVRDYAAHYDRTRHEWRRE